jgi:adenylate cyclase class 2
MTYEVESKHPVTDAIGLERRLADMGAVFGGAESQVDRYFAHPARDFAQTDEALRIRSIGARNLVTYKGPKLDAHTKTRQEIEIAFATGDQTAQAMADLLAALGFRPVAEVRKQRRKAILTWQGFSIEVAWDEVERVGTFLELETSADDEWLDDARGAIMALAATLDLTRSERRSYLELLLEQPRST